jgi:hypothetical protein
MRYNTLYIVCVSIALFFIIGVTAVYASNPNYGRIRGNSSRQNDRIYNKMAIDLINGRANNISIDNMSMFLKNYNIIRFSNGLNLSAKDIITKEIAYRMIKNHYLPRLNDRIEVYRQSVELSKQVIPYLSHNARYPYKASLILPYDYARIKEEKVVDTLRWREVSSQVSSAIQNLWISRVHASSNAPDRGHEDIGIVQALSLLKAACDSQLTHAPGILPKTGRGNILYEAFEAVFELWRANGVASEKNRPLLAALIRDYIILNSTRDIHSLAEAIRDLNSPNKLGNALLESVDNISRDIKQNDPLDYATLAMLQGMLSDISSKLAIISAGADTGRAAIKPRYYRS